MFRYQEEILANEIKSIVEKYGNKRENLLRILQELNDKYNYLSEQVLQNVASCLKISPSEVYGVATFYSFLNTKPKGKYVTRVCKTIVCDLNGKDKII
ncbi:MAG TPA: NAD(P)H-dependent oxidoreductase subunit E, partial [bacterium]|nr:NAD(P)H-dependent oxidoreductase subunit E [bacterium]